MTNQPKLDLSDEGLRKHVKPTGIAALVTDCSIEEISEEILRWLKAVRDQARREEQGWLLVAVEDLRSRYPEDVFPNNGSPDGFSASGARVACRCIEAVIKDRARGEK